MRREPFIATVLLATTLIWGSAPTAIKKLVAVLDPVDLAFARFAISAVFFALLLVIQARRPAPLPVLTGREWGWVVLMGFLGVVGYHVALNGGEQLLASTTSEDVTAILAGFLISLNPLFTLLQAPAFTSERLGGRRTWGVLTALAGTAFLILWGRGVLIGPDALAGALLVLAAPYSWSVYTLVFKRYVRGHDPLAITAYVMIAGTLLLTPLVSPHFLADLNRMTPALWAWLLVLSLGATVGGYITWNYAVHHWDASRVSTFVYLVPLFSLAFAILQAHERLTLNIALGGTLIILGVWWANSSARATRAGRAATPQGDPGPQGK